MSLYGIPEQDFIFLFNLRIIFLTFLAPAVINAVSDIICNCFVSVVIEALLMKPQECSTVIRVISEKVVYSHASETVGGDYAFPSPSEGRWFRLGNHTLSNCAYSCVSKNVPL